MVEFDEEGNGVLSPVLSVFRAWLRCQCYIRRDLTLYSLPLVLQHDSALDPSVRAAVSSSLEALAYSVREGWVFQEARALGDYIQWRHDERQWEEEKLEYERLLGRLQANAENSVATASADYMREHAYEEEAAVWDWCPIWHAITGLEEIRMSLPPLPFQHNGEWITKPFTELVIMF